MPHQCIPRNFFLLLFSAQALLFLSASHALLKPPEGGNPRKRVSFVPCAPPPLILLLPATTTSAFAFQDSRFCHLPSRSHLAVFFFPPPPTSFSESSPFPSLSPSFFQGLQPKPIWSSSTRNYIKWAYAMHFRSFLLLHPRFLLRSITQRDFTKDPKTSHLAVFSADHYVEPPFAFLSRTSVFYFFRRHK